MRFNEFEVLGNVTEQMLGDAPVKMVWIAQSPLPEIPHNPKSRKVWTTVLTADTFKQLLPALSDMRKWNKVKMRVCVVVLIPQDSKMEDFREF